MADVPFLRLSEIGDRGGELEHSIEDAAEGHEESGRVSGKERSLLNEGAVSCIKSFHSKKPVISKKILTLQIKNLMATSEQILGLIKSHFDGDNDRFKTLALQLSVAEAKAGHTVFSHAIKDLLSKPNLQIHRPTFKQLSADISEYLLLGKDDASMASLVITKAIDEKIKRIILEYIQREKLHKYNLENRRKVLLYGPSGTGKTMSASVIANELRLPLYVVRLEKIVTKFMGETGLKLSKVFDCIEQLPGIYLFDEFDAIGFQRGVDNEVGEMRRVLNTFLQLMERESSNSIIIAATNDVKSLDKALFRRFDDVIEYQLPDTFEIERLIANTFVDFKLIGNINELSKILKGRSCADIVEICRDAIKSHILDDMELSVSNIISLIESRTLISKIG